MSFIQKLTRPFIIAEMSGNHNQSLQKALDIVDAAAAAGVQALKLQTYTADTITMRGVMRIDDQDSLWSGRELHDLYSQAYTPWEWHAPIFERAKKHGLMAFSSPFDETAVDFLESLEVPLYKIASFENTHHPLLRKAARTGKPIIMSTGVASFEEITESVEVLRREGCREIILLKCTSTYPATPENTNLITIPYMREKFNCEIGLSDHTMGIGVAVASIGLGVRVIEKHFTISRSEGGVDSAFSMEPSEMISLVTEAGRAFQALGTVQTTVQAAEEKSRLFKRSIYVAEDIPAGTKLNEKNLRVIRPALGLAPREWDNVMGKTAARFLKSGTPLQSDDFV